MKQLLMLIQLFILIVALKSDREIRQVDDRIDWKCTQMDTAHIVYEVVLDSQTVDTSGRLEIEYQYEVCNKCDLIPFKTIELENMTPTLDSTLDSYYSYYFQVYWTSADNSSTAVLCDRFLYSKFGECGVYKFRVDLNAGVCEIEQIQNPQNSDLYMILAVGLIVVFFSICIFVEAYHKRIENYLKRNFCRKILDSNSDEQQNVMVEVNKNSQLQPITEKPSLDDTKTSPATENKAEIKTSPTPVANKKRLRALDTFRGLSLFLMIFVNYGSGKTLRSDFIMIFDLNMSKYSQNLSQNRFWFYKSI